MSTKEQMVFDFEVVIFRDGTQSALKLNLDASAETIWATQAEVAALFGVDRTVVARHFRNVFADGELDEAAVCAKFARTADDGKAYQTLHYNLDAVLSVGYRVSSKQATEFRRWASRTLKAYVIDGYALDESRLGRDPAALRELAAKVRALRSDERQIYEAVRECFKLAASDYDAQSPRTRSFYSRLQDKFLYAITGQTASELILSRADGRKPDMGLQTITGRVPTKAEAATGKNYLITDELYILHILCEQFLLYAESKAIRGQKMTMAELDNKLDRLLTTNEYPVFPGYKNYLAARAKEHAELEYQLYLKRVKVGQASERL